MRWMSLERWEVRAYCHVAVGVLGMHVLPGEPSPEEERTCFNVATTTPLPECSQVVRMAWRGARAMYFSALAAFDPLQPVQPPSLRY